MFKARPAIRCAGCAASGTEMSPRHVQRGTFCQVSIIRYGTIDARKSLVRTGDSASPQITETPQINLCASVCIHKYTWKYTHAGVITNCGTCWLQKHYAGHLPCPMWTQEKPRWNKMKEWENDKIYLKRLRQWTNLKHVPSLCCHKIQLVFKTKYHNQIISTHWNIARVLNHPTEQSF